MSRTLLLPALGAAALVRTLTTAQAQQTQQPSGQTQQAPTTQPPRQTPPTEPSSQPPRTPPTTTTQPRGTGEPQGTAEGTARKGMPSDAAGFINQMTIANLAEVQLGKLASERASNADVKSYGQMMVKDHTQANQDLAQVAAQMKVKPTKSLDQKHKDLAAKLSKLQGAEFDREYMNAMVQGHQEVAGQLEAHTGANQASSATGEGRSTTSDPSNRPGEASSGTSRTPTQSSGGVQGSTRKDGDQHALTEWARQTLPTVQKHLERARELQKQVSK